MQVYQNKLWVFGGFEHAANFKGNGAAVYDGIYWCTLNDSLDNKIGSAAVFNDTLYVAGGFSSCNGDPGVHYLAKLKGPSGYKGCVNVGIKEEKDEGAYLSLYPNPAADYFILENSNAGISEAEVMNEIGQLIISQQVTEARKKINVNYLPAGIYTIKLTEKNGLNQTKKLVIVR